MPLNSWQGIEITFLNIDFTDVHLLLYDVNLSVSYSKNTMKFYLNLKKLN